MIFFQDKLLKVITQAQLAKILSFYGQFKLQSFTPKSGWENLILRIATDSDIFSLRIYRNPNLEKIKLSLEVIKYLVNSGFPVPNFIETCDGEKIIQVKFGKFTQPVVLFAYLEGRIKGILSPSDITQFGQLVGKLHLVLKEFKPLIKPPRLNLKKHTSSVRKQIYQEFGNRHPIFNLWQRFYPVIEENFPNETGLLLGNQLIHGDLAHSNILFQIKGLQIVGILDLDEVKLAPKIWDLANFIVNYTLTLRSRNNFTKIYQMLKSLLTGYEKSCRLLPEERQLLPIIIRLWFFKKIIWARAETAKKYRAGWAADVMSWCVAALEEKF